MKKTKTEAGMADGVEAKQREAKQGSGVKIASNVRAGRNQLYPTSGSTDGY